jgi:hypothetical protein
MIISFHQECETPRSGSHQREQRLSAGKHPWARPGFARDLVNIFVDDLFDLGM